MDPNVLLGWLPAPVLVGLLYIFIKREFAANYKRWARIELFLENAHKLATSEQLAAMKTEFAQSLTNMGNRFDAKVVEAEKERVRIEKDLAVTNNELKNALARISTLEMLTRK